MEKIKRESIVGKPNVFSLSHIDLYSLAFSVFVKMCALTYLQQVFAGSHKKNEMKTKYGPKMWYLMELIGKIC